MGATAIVLLALLAQAAGPTTDTQGKAKAQGLLNEGSRLYGEGDYAGALDKFNTAYAAYPSPKLIFNVGQASRDLGRPVEALQAFEKFLTGELNATPETTAEARKSLAELREKLGRIRIECATPDTEVSLDGKGVGMTPLTEPIWATPGRHQVTANRARAAMAIENVTVTAGSLQVVTLNLHSLADPVVAAPAPPGNSATDLTSSPNAPAQAAGESPMYKKWWVWTGVGAVVVGGAVTAFLLTRRSDNPCGGIGYTCLEIR
jgi:PEGA domain